VSRALGWSSLEALPIIPCGWERSPTHNSLVPTHRELWVGFPGYGMEKV